MDTQDKSYTSMCTTDYIEIAGFKDLICRKYICILILWSFFIGVSTTCGGPTQATTLCGKFVCGASECIANAPFCGKNSIFSERYSTKNPFRHEIYYK